MKKYIVGVLVLFILVGCSKDSSPAVPSGLQVEDTPNRIESVESLFTRKPLTLEYATKFAVDPVGSKSWLLRIVEPWPDSTEEVTYLLLHRDETESVSEPMAITVPIPLTKAAAFNSATLEGIFQLGAIESVVGTDDANFTSNPDIVERLASGLITPMAPGGTLNEEVLLEVAPEAVFINVVNPTYDTRSLLERSGVTPLITSAWLETHPLGRAEWIKFIGLFFGLEEPATWQFNSVVSTYNATMELLKSVEKKPTVCTGFPFGNTWYIAGGSSYLAQLIQDAGGEYLWKDLEESGSVPTALEVAYERNNEADVWINAGWGWRTYNDVLGGDSRFEEYQSFQNRNIWHVEKQVASNGANGYYSSGALNPQIVLMDLASIFHPQLFPEYKQVYYGPME